MLLTYGHSKSNIPGYFPVKMLHHPASRSMMIQDPQTACELTQFHSINITSHHWKAMFFRNAFPDGQGLYIFLFQVCPTCNTVHICMYHRVQDTPWILLFGSWNEPPELENWDSWAVRYDSPRAVAVAKLTHSQ